MAKERVPTHGFIDENGRCFTTHYKEVEIPMPDATWRNEQWYAEYSKVRNMAHKAVCDTDYSAVDKDLTAEEIYDKAKRIAQDHNACLPLADPEHQVQDMMDALTSCKGYFEAARVVEGEQVGIMGMLNLINKALVQPSGESGGK